MKEASQLELKTIKTIPKVRRTQALWAEQNKSKQECLKVAFFHRIRNFQQEKKNQQNRHKNIQSKSLFISM